MPSEALPASARTGRFFAKVVDDPGCRHFDPKCRNGGFTDISVFMVRSARQAARVDNRGLLRVQRVHHDGIPCARVRVHGMPGMVLHGVPDDLL